MKKQDMEKLAGKFANALAKAFELRYPASTDRTLSPVKQVTFNPIDLYQLLSGQQGAVPNITGEDLDLIAGTDPNDADAATVKRGIAIIDEMTRASKEAEQFMGFRELVQDYLDAEDADAEGPQAELFIVEVAGNFKWSVIDMSRLSSGHLDF